MPIFMEHGNGIIGHLQRKPVMPICGNFGKAWFDLYLGPQWTLQGIFVFEYLPSLAFWHGFLEGFVHQFQAHAHFIGRWTVPWALRLDGGQLNLNWIFFVAF